MFVTFAAVASPTEPTRPGSLKMEIQGHPMNVLARTMEFKKREEFFDWWSAYGVRLWQAHATAQTLGSSFVTLPGM